MIDWKPIQKRLGIAPDGIAGRYTFSTLLAHVAERSLADRGVLLGAGCAQHFTAYDITTPLRLAHFIAQACHESGRFKYMQEIWGPTAAQRKYELRADLGNVCVGDGKRYAGRGIFQLTGRANYREVGDRIGLDLEQDPELAAQPGISVMIACDYWRSRKINVPADRDDVMAVTRKINGGLTGIEDRMRRLSRAKEILL
jgi:putative chitinase